MVELSSRTGASIAPALVNSVVSVVGPWVSVGTRLAHQGLLAPAAAAYRFHLKQE
jgi:hypothetical protein